MNAVIVKVLEAQYITHDVKRFVLEKPPGYVFKPGQSAYLSVNLPDWKNQERAFTFTGLPEWDHLEFMIKIYNERKGVTSMLGKTNAGAELILHEPFGAIEFKGPGVFLAAGSGITPFLSIFRDLHRKKKLKGNRLIYTNKTSADVIRGEELFKMLKNDFLNVYTRENIIGFVVRRIDREFLIEYVADFSRHFYVCGPEDFVKDISSVLIDLGVSPATLVVES